MIHILVVDDDKNINQAVCTYLNDCGFETKGFFDLHCTTAYIRTSGLYADGF